MSQSGVSASTLSRRQLAAATAAALLSAAASAEGQAPPHKAPAPSPELESQVEALKKQGIHLTDAQWKDVETGIQGNDRMGDRLRKVNCPDGGAEPATRYSPLLNVDGRA